MAGIDVGRDARRKRCRELQERLTNASGPALFGGQRWKRAKEVWRDVRRYLFKASDEGLIAQAHSDIHKWFQFSDDGDPRIETATHSMRYGQGVNFDRLPEFPHLTRVADSAWFDFQLSVRESKEGVEILAYDFELRFPGSPVEFVRLDMNHPDHDNEDEGLRSHLHLSSDDDGFVVPAAIMDPYELLDVMLHGALRTGRERRRRRPEA